MRTLKPKDNPADALRHLYVEESCLDLPYTREILGRSRLPYSILGEKAEPALPLDDGRVNFTEGKRHLYLCRNRGRFFKTCPGTTGYGCCNYQILNVGMNCPMDCVYCILQAYLNKPWISHFVNIDDMFQEMEQAAAAEPKRRFRVGTGEFTDSLALDALTGLSTKLIDFVAVRRQFILELKTKSVCIERLHGVCHGGRVVVSWSLNAPLIMQREELRTASLAQRLTAAKQCAEWGYKLGFHFDPIIDHPGWREGYAQTIDALFRTVPQEAIVWISLGALRYLPQLKDIGTERFPGSRIFYQEFIEGLDGKCRYFRPHRAEMYAAVYERLKQRAAKNTCIYFCMESDEIWKEVAGFIPDAQGGIPAMLDRAVFHGEGEI